MSKNSIGVFIKNLSRSVINKIDYKKNTSFIFLIFILGFGLRLFISFRGYNFDVESYWIVGDLVNSGKNVYANTVRYNYGPIWFIILGLFYKVNNLFEGDIKTFHLIIAFFLSIVDIIFAYILVKKFNLLAGILFLFNPISIIITGFHSQFDNFAILAGFIAILLLSKSTTKVSDNLLKTDLYVGLLLGLSITIKHILILLPIWLAIKEKNLIRKCFYALFPILIFFLSFAPFLGKGGYAGIMQNVFGYDSFLNAPFLFGTFPESIVKIWQSYFNLEKFLKPLFLVFIIVLGFIFRKKNALDTFLLYLISFLVFSPSVANQYLAIVVVPISIWPNFFYTVYTFLSFIFLSGDYSGLSYSKIRRLFPFFDSQKYNLSVYNLLIFTIFMGFLVNLKIINLYQIYNKLVDFIKREFSFQISTLTKFISSRKN
jgi:hypothetical protein